MSLSDMPTGVSQLSRSQLTMVSKKGKEVAGGEDSSGKRKRDDDTAKTGHRRKRKNLGVLQFFEDAALEVDEDEASDDSDIGDDFLDNDFNTQVKVKNEPGKAHHLPFFLKKEELSEEELEKILEERYKPGSGLVTYAGDKCNRLIERNAVIPLSSDPTIWKVKCMVGREKQSVFCLMQKYVDLHVLGTKLQIISAFALEHVKGFIYIEAERQFDINEACKGLFTICSSRLAPVGKNEVSRSFSVQRKYNEVSVGTWVRVKNGKYKGDLAQVIAVNDARKRATVKLIPRIDMQAMAEKFGGGIASKKTATPASRLISSTELEEFQPFIQYRHDRDTGQAFEVLDGLMLKDGYLYKKVSIDSLTFWGVMPSEDELLKFEPSKEEESDCEEWLTQLYGEQKEKRIIKSDKCVGKGKGSTGSSMASNFEVHDLVFFNRKGFGVIVGTEKDDHFKILKDDSEGPVVVTFELKQLKNGSFDKKFIALDHRMKTISINDTVRVLEGPLQGRQGIVKQIYRGTIFLYDENEQENSGIICCKSQICEKIILSDDARNGKGGKSGPPAFDNFLSSPKSPLSPKKPWKTRENNSNFNREDKDGIFSIGQSLRIRVGPLKGYLCHVLAIHRSDVTVKLDSQQKTLTVKCEHLSMVRGKSSAICSGADAESAKPLDLHGTQDCSGDWMAGAGTSTEGKGWGAGGLSTERNSCPALPSSGFSLQPESNFANPLISVDNDSNKVCGKKNNANKNQDDGWKKSREPFDGGKNATENLTSSWSNATSGKNPLDSRGKGKGGGSDISIWGKAVDSVDKGTGERIPEGSWGKAAEKWGSRYGFIGNKAPWNGSLTEPKNQVGGWGNAGGKLGDESKERTVQNDRCKPLGGNRGFGGWNKSGMGNQGDTDQQEIWDRTKTFDGGHCSGGRRGNRGSRGGRDQFGRGRSFGRGQSFGWSKEGQGYHGKDPLDSWGNGKDGASDRSTWGKAVNFVGEGTAEGTKAVWNQGSKNGSWGNAGGSSWNKQGGGSSWTKQNDVNTGDESRERTYQNDSWGNPSGGDRGFSGWNKNGMGNKDDAGQQESRDRTKTFGGGSGSGGRRGRGGSRGGRDQFGRGRSDRGCFRGRCGSDSGAFGGRGQSDHGTGDGTSSANLSSWSGGQAGVWGRGKVFDGGEDNRSDRGGFRDRGQSNRGGYGGRGRSDRGGFQGRGRSEREGFGGRGHGRKDQNGDWCSRNDSVEDKTSSWNKGSISAEGWKSNDSGDRWNQDGGDKAQNCNSGWKPSKGTMGRGGANGQAGGWNRGTGSSKDGGPADTWGKPAASSWGSKGRQ